MDNIGIKAGMDNIGIQADMDNIGKGSKDTFCGNYIGGTGYSEPRDFCLHGYSGGEDNIGLHTSDKI